MVRRGALLVAALAATACGRTPTAPAARVAADWTAIPAEDPLRVPDFVALSGTAALHERPSDDSDSVVAVPSPAALAPAAHPRPADLRVFRFSEQRDGWVAVDTLLTRQAHCYPKVETLEGMRLRFYVHANDLARVTVKNADVRLPDGRTLSLMSGVALVGASSDEGTYAPVLADLDVAVRLPADATGFRYRWDIEDFRGAVRKGCGVLPGHRAPETLLISMNSWHRPMAFGIRAGAIAYWPSGLPAGTAVGKAVVGDEVAASGGRRCFEAWLAHAKDRAALAQRQILHLCFAPGDVAADARRTNIYGWARR